MPAEPPQVPVLWLDLDSTVRKGFGELGRFVDGPEDVEVFPAAVEMMRRWKEGGGRIVGVTNQGGIALGHVTQRAVEAALRETHRQAGGLFDKIGYCCHHPDAKTPVMARCWCRKPRAGLIVATGIELAKLCPGEMYPPHLGLMVGDRPEDEQCAAAANLDFEWAKDWRSRA